MIKSNGKQAAANKKTTPKTSILIVEDDPDTRDLMSYMLRGNNYSLVFARDGFEALAQARLHRPDLVLLDVMLPGIDGFEVCRRLRGDAILAEVPILILTVLNTHEAYMEGFEAGADDFINKPYNTVELRARIETILRVNRYRQLVNQRARFEWVVENTDDGYLVINAEDEILYANPHARIYLGLPANSKFPLTETFLTIAMRQYRCEPSEEWFDWENQSLLTTQQPRYLYRPDSPQVPATWLEVTMHMGSADTADQWLIRIRDVTQKMASQRDIWAFHKMVTHKLRTPLINMVNGMELLSKHGDKIPGEEITEIADKALRSVKNLQNEINDIVRYLDAPNLVEEGHKLSVQEIAPLIDRINEIVGIASIAVKIPPELESLVLNINAQSMEWILLELLENAQKFHPSQSPRVAILVDQPEKDQIRIRVIDDGMKVPSEQLALVWLPYYQSEKHFTGQVAGMGLGLSMVASLIWGAGGSCQMYNRKTEPGVAVDLVVPIYTSDN